MPTTPTGPVEELRAQQECALLLDSPHSGTHYPADFDHACERSLLKLTEDAHVDTLFGFAPLLGATLLRARFPRCYIDVNRPIDDVDPLLLDPRAKPGHLTDKSRLGMGLVWRLVNGQAIYRRPLTACEVQHRVDAYWRPYHAALDAAWARITRRHGWGIHLNCHSMPSASPHYPPPLDGRMPYDFIIGTRDHTTASPGLAQHVAQLLRGHGWRVAVNEIFKGVELIARTGSPQQDRHALQIEVNKRLYMDEHTLLPHAGFGEVEAGLRTLVESLAGLTLADLKGL